MEFDFALILSALYIAAFIVIMGRIILRPQREPASRLAWLIATIAVPVVGILAYLLLGEARISAKRRARYAAIEAHLPHPHDNAGVRRMLARSAWAAPFALAETVNALPPTAAIAPRWPRTAMPRSARWPRTSTGRNRPSTSASISGLPTIMAFGSRMRWCAPRGAG